MRTQEIVVEVDRIAIHQRIHNRRGATLRVTHSVLGDDGDPKAASVKVLFRDDKPMVAGFFTP
ncbi:MAG: hypothetical protein ABIV63_03475 [Caldimonas sp.]